MTTERSWKSLSNKWFNSAACVNCRYYENNWCYWHNTPACPYARCDEFKPKLTREKDRKP